MVKNKKKREKRKILLSLSQGVVLSKHQSKNIIF